ncbi:MULTISPECIES: HU family DNA-binding protein [Sphingomonadaceae]|jgi:integration host factor subunit beta|uniref:Integration host factor subunit beta n=1 Tax=Sphingomonas bisphenolicum TaxID=296544 RepID=A0ABM7FZF3_9SPHN|nr:MULTISPECIES: HU family DNA-binding protein [Sphingomonadaceae]KAA9012083.1 integration host factor subunit beta [Sphingobium limneticum]BBF70509.1 integration host factor subunit beta [Sphingomonas bisphenolicum]
MIKSELIAKMKEDFPGLADADVDKIVNLFFDSIIAQINAGGRVELRGFGAFSVRSYEARTGRNPRTGGAVEVPAKDRLHFKAGKAIMERINGSDKVS